jgi:L-fuconolactonase
VDHGAKPSIGGGVDLAENNRWRELMADVAALPNVVCKVSGLITETVWFDWSDETVAPYLRFLADRFGGDRVLAGSDWPVCLLAGSFADGFELPERVLRPSPSELVLLMRDNAVAAYRIGS